jgi:hypothetical protein
MMKHDAITLGEMTFPVSGLGFRAFRVRDETCCNHLHEEDFEKFGGV